MRSRGNAQSASSTTRKRPNVRFGNIIVREFSSGIGGSVASAGPSVGLGQVLKREEEIGIDAYEKNEHGGRRALTPLEFWLPPAVRLQRLQSAGVKKNVIDMEGRQEEVLRRHRAAAMMDNLSIRLMEADPENYSCTLATLRKAQLLQQQRIMMANAAAQRSSNVIPRNFQLNQHQRQIPQYRRQGTPLVRRRPRNRVQQQQNRNNTNGGVSPYAINQSNRQQQQNHDYAGQLEQQQQQQLQMSQMGRAQRIGGLSNSYQQNAQQQNGSGSMQGSASAQSLSQARSKNNGKWGSQYQSPSKYRPRTALGRLEISKNASMRRSGLQSAGSSRIRNTNSNRSQSNLRRPMSSGRRSMNSWSLSGSRDRGFGHSGSGGRIARGIASRRGRKKKKKSDSLLWKLNGKKAGGGNS
eukprot:g11259.t1